MGNQQITLFNTDIVTTPALYEQFLNSQVTQNISNLVLILILPLVSLTLEAFNVSSIYAHQNNDTFENLGSIGYFGDDLTDNLYRVNINWLAIESIVQILSTVSRISFTILGIYVLGNSLFNQATGGSLI